MGDINFIDLGFTRTPQYVIKGDNLLQKISSLFVMWFFGANGLDETEPRKYKHDERGLAKYEMDLDNGKLKVNLFVGYDNDIVRITSGRQYLNGDFIIYYEKDDNIQLVFSGNNGISSIIRENSTESEVKTAIREFRLKNLLD